MVDLHHGVVQQVTAALDMKSLAYESLFVVALAGLMWFAFSFAAEECKQDKPKKIVNAAVAAGRAFRVPSAMPPVTRSARFSFS
jgi:hypothetical protein